MREPIVEPRPGKGKDPGDDDEHNERAEKATVGELLRQKRGDVSAEEVLIYPQATMTAPAQ